MTAMVQYKGVSNTSATCSSVARWHINNAKNTKESFYPRMAARLFTIFMAEGVLNAVGEIMHDDWKEKDSLLKKNLTIRQTLGLSNSGAEYQKIKPLIESLVAFRHQLAHPKIIAGKKDIAADEVDSPRLPSITHWEEMMEQHTEEAEYERLTDYLRSLLEVAQSWLEKNVSYEKRSHFPDVRGLLHVTGTFSASPI